MVRVRSSEGKRRGPGRLVAWCLLCAALMALGIGLGLWQWERAAGKRDYLANLAEAPTLNMPGTLPPDGSRLSLEGVFQADETLYLDNRMLGNRLGVAVLTPFVDVEGQRWLVERGFLETGVSRQAPYAETPKGLVSLSGDWQADGRRTPRFGDNLEGTRLQRIELGAWNEEFSFAGWLHQRQGPGHLEDWWTPNVMPPERHLAYALQWWGLSLVALLALLFGGRRLYRDLCAAGVTSAERSIVDMAARQER
ncbi:MULTISPECIES: SURF1 family protein [unclassified Halomonas]|uniref:SURF1 family protein n=1 Tax=unclassified Halomonas TaxID=2609666 RepID=UPI000C921BA6|nr:MULTISPECIES: SURF1 family protein [unclassified Halomonas]MAR70984.1 Surfeit locus 1 [Halomonas sp.]